MNPGTHGFVSKIILLTDFSQGLAVLVRHKRSFRARFVEFRIPQPPKPPGACADRARLRS